MHSLCAHDPFQTFRSTSKNHHKAVVKELLAPEESIDLGGCEWFGEFIEYSNCPLTERYFDFLGSNHLQATLPPPYSAMLTGSISQRRISTTNARFPLAPQRFWDHVAWHKDSGTIHTLFPTAELGSSHAGQYSRFEFRFMFRSRSTQKGQMNPFTEGAFRIAITFIVFLAPLSIVMANEPSPLDLVRWGLTRWWVLESPIWVTSREQCDAFAKEFADEFARLNKLHDDCLLEADPSEPSGNAGCSKAYCQPLHTARIQANEKSASQIRLCLDRLNEFLSKQDVNPQAGGKPGIVQSQPPTTALPQKLATTNPFKKNKKHAPENSADNTGNPMQKSDGHSGSTKNPFARLPAFSKASDTEIIRSPLTHRTAAASSVVYMADSEAASRGLNVIAKYSVGDNFKKTIDDEIKVRVYQDASQSGKVIVTIRGTDNLMNWITNVGLQFPQSVLDQYAIASATVLRQVIRDYDSDAIILTGHSLGGALANILGQRSGIQTITFNAPPVDVFAVHAQSLGTKVSAALGTPSGINQDKPFNIVNVRLEGDPVSGLAGRQTGRTIEIAAEPQSGFKSPLDILAQPVETHGMEAVEKWLRKASQ